MRKQPSRCESARTDPSRGVSKNANEAAKWYRKAAEQGHAKAQVHLGTIHCTGDGVDIDPTEAFKWFSKAVEQGDSDGQYFLASFYNGEVVAYPKNSSEAIKWYRKSADQGNASARDALKKLGVSGY